MTNSLRAVFLDHASLDLGDLDLTPLRQQFAELELHDQTGHRDVVGRLRGAQVAISNKVTIDAAAIAELQPDIAFLDIQMPGLTGLEVAQGIEGGTRVVATLNGTAVTNTRPIVALLENHQQADGSVRVPAALQPFLGAEVIRPR